MPRELGVAHETEDYWRVKVSGKKCAPRSLRYKTISEKKGIKALICCPAGEFEAGRCRDGMTVRTVLYDKDKFSKKQAEEHSKEFRR